MLTFFTVMIITYSAQGEEVQSRLLYSSQRACSDAMAAAEALVDASMTVEMVQCQESNLISRAPRPKARPEGLS
jgi:hypothetical protein